MTRDTPFDRSITTVDAFSATLNELLLVAYANGVDVAGGWECRTDGTTPDWETVITELEKRPGSGADGLD